MSREKQPPRRRDATAENDARLLPLQAPGFSADGARSHARYGHNFADISIFPPTPGQSPPIQGKLEDIFEPRPDKYASKALPEEYADEQNVFPHQHDSRTIYYTPAEQEAHRIDFQGGRMHQGGSRVDTLGAASTSMGRMKAEDAHIAAMDAHGEFFSADALAEMNQINAGRGDGDVKDRVHHSTLVAGGAVAGAGTLQVTDGQLQNVSDKSGHYKPDGSMTYNMVSELDKRGAMTDTRPDADGDAVNKPATVTLGAKPAPAADFRDFERGPRTPLEKLREAPAPTRNTSQDITLTGDQYLQTRGNEDQIRKKAMLNAQILDRVPVVTQDAEEEPTYDATPVTVRSGSGSVAPTVSAAETLDTAVGPAQTVPEHLYNLPREAPALGAPQSARPKFSDEHLARKRPAPVAPGAALMPAPMPSAITGDYSVTPVSVRGGGSASPSVPQVAPSQRPQITAEQLARRRAVPLPPTADDQI